MNTHASLYESLDGLPHWATITQVSTALLVPRTTIRGTVRRALADKEAWVKRADEDDEQSPYLIDTTHPIFLAHAQRWTENQAQEYTPEGLEEPFFLPSPPLEPPSSKGDIVLQRWSFFREKLHSWGIQIFQNILAAEEDEWQWRWGELHGEGYASEEQAIVAALQSRLDVQERKVFQTVLPTTPPPPLHHTMSEPSLFSFFPGKSKKRPRSY